MALLDYFDSPWRLLAQKAPGRDGGDTAQRMGMYHFGLWVRNRLGICNDKLPYSTKKDFEIALHMLECPDSWGNFRRHPDPTMWYSDNDRMSRDQTIPLICAMGAYKLRAPMWRYFLRHLFCRGLWFTTNTRRNWVYPKGHIKWEPDMNYKWKVPDITFMSFWAMYIRSFNWWLLYPLLCILDLEMVIGTMIKVWSYAKDPDHGDDLNHIIQMVQAIMVMPTPLSWLAQKIYKLRPKANAPAVGYQSDFGPQTALDWYFRDENNDPPLNEIYRPIVDKLLK